MTGQQLFRLYVEAALCSGEYRWDQLKPTMQERWAYLAAQLEKPQAASLRWLEVNTTIRSTVNQGSRKYPDMREVVEEETTTILQYLDGDTWREVPIEYEKRETNL